MPRNFNKYQYETSPRKLEPEYAPKKNTYKGKKSTTKKQLVKKTNNNKKGKRENRKEKQTIKYITIGFIILFAMCFQNAKIDENFEKVKDLKKELAIVEKENSQLELELESNLNLANIEQQAKELLGMQKLTNKQIVYVNLEKDDHVEAAAESVKIAKESIITKGIKILKRLFK